VEEVLPYIRAVRSRIQKREYFDIAMDALRVSDVSLRRELWQTLRGGAPEKVSAGQRVLRSSTQQPTIAEQRLLEMLLAHAESRQRILPRLEVDDYEDLATAPVFRALLELAATGTDFDFESVQHKVGDEVGPELLARLFANAPQLDDEGKPIHGHTGESCLAELRLEAVNRRIREVASQMIYAEREGNLDERDKLALEQIELTKRRSTLMPQSLSAEV